MAARKETEKKRDGHELIGEIWGIAYVALGLLVLISLLSRYVGRPDILGPIFGRQLSQGLLVLLGALPALLLPAGMIALGWRQIRGTPVSFRALLVWFVLTAEVAAILAVHNIRYVTRGSFPFSDNYLGNGATYLLHYVFGAHPVGPYFLLAVALVISIVLLFRINVATLIARTIDALRAAGALSQKGVEMVAAHREAAREEAEEDEAEEPIDEEALRRMEEQRAAFRAKKNEPVTITTYDAPPEPDPVDEEEAEEPDEGEGGDSFTPAETKAPAKPYQIPSPDVLSDPPPESTVVDRGLLEEMSHTLEKTLLSFGVEGKVVNISPGPVINRFEIELAPGIKVSKIVNLQDDISLAVGGQRIRILAPIPGKSAVGIELPNPNREIVHFKNILLSDAFRRAKGKLPIVIGKSTSGAPYVSDINRMPHLLIAGQTGSGKSVCINSIICSLLMTKSPEELRMIMVDPKKVELSAYEGIPHLLSPVVTESKEAVKALQWGVIEMERRYRLLAKMGARDIESFNARVLSGKIPEGIELTQLENKPLPFIVILVDELADLMMTASRDVETLIMRIAQLARAVGLHLIVATQRPSVDIITGPIKANLPSRIGFRTVQSTDSRTILGTVGAEKLLGMGDMLYLRNGAPDLERYHGAFISEEDVEHLVRVIREQYVEVEKIHRFDDVVADHGGPATGSSGGDRDELFDEAAKVIVGLGQGSTSLLQRRMKIGYARAGRLMDELEREGIVGAQEGSKMREVLIRPDELELLLNNLKEQG